MSVDMELLNEQVRAMQARIAALEQADQDDDDEWLELLAHLAPGGGDAAAAAGADLALWDLAERGDASATLRGHAAGVYIAGVKVEPGAGAGAAKSSDAIGPVYELTFGAAALCVYLLTTRTAGGGTASIVCSGTEFPDGDDDDEVFPLWQVGWNSTNSKVDWSQIIDMRHSQRWTAGA